MTNKLTTEQKLNYINFADKIHKARSMGLFETALDNIQSGKTHEENKLIRKQELEKLTKDADVLRKDIDDYIVKNGYDYLFIK